MKRLLRNSLPDIIVVVLFVLVSFAYFFPADIEGRILFQHDASAGKGMGQEIKEYYEKTGDRSRWTTSLFCGMPTYQIAPAYASNAPVEYVESAYHLFLPDYVWYLFVYLIGFYILLRAMGLRWHLSALGTVMWSFSTYFLIIIAAGHIYKVWALAYLPPMIAGIVLAYRGKYLWGLVLTALFSAFEVKANHPQMTYYYLFVIAAMVIAYIIEAAKRKDWKHIAKATGVCAIGATLGILVNISNLYHTWEYQKETMRGKSELVKENSANQTDSGLERDYITQWSYGIGETWSLLVPNVKGGSSSHRMADSETAMAKADINYAQLYQQMPQYFGEQPFTAGPVYIGALVCMLVILALLTVKGPMKWALLAVTVLTVMLSWGKNFMGLTDFFIDHFPMYSKFRTVSSILVVAEFTLPLLAILGLREILDSSENSKLKTQNSKLYISFGITAGICLLMAVSPSLFFDSFISTAERQAFSQYPNEQIMPLFQNLSAMRQAMVSADAWRSFAIVAVGMALILLCRHKVLKQTTAVCLLAALCLFDLWGVNKRYLHDDMFVPKSVRTAPVQATPAVSAIAEADKSLGYRVLNYTTDTFNENETSYYLKSIGGYHPAKLRRYQELIEYHIHPEMAALPSALNHAEGDITQINGDSVMPVLNMLNTKYFIFGQNSQQQFPIENPWAMGGAWYVSQVKYVNNANEEIELLDNVDLHDVAVVDKQFTEAIGESAVQDSLSRVEIKEHECNRILYEAESAKGGVIVFSETYYPGWKATVDGEEVPVGRANYVLRAINVKPGKHTIEFTFFPQTVKTTETIAYVSFALFALILLLAVGLETRKLRKR